MLRFLPQALRDWEARAEERGESAHSAGIYRVRQAAYEVRGGQDTKTGLEIKVVEEESCRGGR